MKPFEQFLEQMKEAARLAQTKDPKAATEVIQEALKAAGLLPVQTPQATARAGAGMATGARMGESSPMVDLNAVPDWAQAVRRSASRRGRKGVVQLDARAPGEFLQGTFSGEAGKRNYKLYVPSVMASGPRPLIVMLHGCTQNPDDFAAGTLMNVLAEEHGLLVLYPEQSRAANSSQCWNWFEAAHQERDGGEPSLLADMTREVIETWQADPKRVYVAGLSAGGAMAAILGLAYPELYAAVGVHSGLPVGSAHDLITGLAAMKKASTRSATTARALPQRVPVIVFHGDRDGVVHPGNGDAILQQFLHPAPGSPAQALHRQQERGPETDGRGYTRTAMLDHSGRSVAEYWELHGTGHGWSGGSPAGTYTEPQGPDASAEMVRFFLGLQTARSPDSPA
jgi:poly(hydroxyalkanoate) depolymerase family esterase